MYLHDLVTISKVVNDRERLLEARAACQSHIGDQLAHCDDDLNEKHFQYLERKVEKPCVLVLYVPPFYLQVGAEEGLLFGVLVVIPHQQVQQNRRLGPQGRQLGDAALEHFAAESLAERHAALEQH